MTRGDVSPCVSAEAAKADAEVTGNHRLHVHGFHERFDAHEQAKKKARTGTNTQNLPPSPLAWSGWGYRERKDVTPANPNQIFMTINFVLLRWFFKREPPKS